MPRHSDIEETYAMHAYYEEGHSLRETGKEYKMAAQTIRQRFINLGLPIRSNTEGVKMRSNNDDTHVMYDDYKIGFSLVDLAEKYFYHATTIYSRFKRRDLKMRSRGRHSNFDS